MGLFDFVKEAGAKIAGGLFGGDEKAEAKAAEDLTKTVTSLKLPVRDLSIKVKDDVATVSGVTPSQVDREKIILAVGNSKGIAKVDDRLRVEAPAAKPEAAKAAPAAAAQPQATFYTVKSGDTLSKIAKAHYGDAMKYPVIFEANRPMLEHPDKIYPGQVLRIPPQ